MSEEYQKSAGGLQPVVIQSKIWCQVGMDLIWACDNCGEWYHELPNSMIPSEAWTDYSYKWTCDLCYLLFCFCILIMYFALPTCKLTEIEIYCTVMAKSSKTKKIYGSPQFHGRVPECDNFRFIL